MYLYVCQKEEKKNLTLLIALFLVQQIPLGGKV